MMAEDENRVAKKEVLAQQVDKPTMEKVKGAKKGICTAKRHGMRTKKDATDGNQELGVKLIQNEVENSLRDEATGDPTSATSGKHVAWKLNQEVIKVIETGVALGFNFNSQVEDIGVEITMRELEDEAAPRAARKRD
ncbi:hypothetical protein LWI28_026386 [Acer negundo]|uniref:Uncharacterized protein n=1 Tax=Acer negundo TaxID=4023 RepID=A0AAD5J851_ACENE|nr:hypothetical protein LWI28_026386 [Acer negundo]